MGEAFQVTPRAPSGVHVTDAQAGSAMGNIGGEAAIAGAGLFRAQAAPNLIIIGGPLEDLRDSRIHIPRPRIRVKSDLMDRSLLDQFAEGEVARGVFGIRITVVDGVFLAEEAGIIVRTRS